MILSLDIGTSKIACGLFARQAKVLPIIEIVANDGTLSGLAAGRHEQDPERIFQRSLALMKTVIVQSGAARETIQGIVVTGQMHGMLLVDESGSPLTNLVTWCDQRANDLLASLDQKEWPVERTGCRLRAGYGGATLAFWAQSNEIPGNAAALSIADYVTAKLCGVKATEPTHAASWGIMDVRRGQWDRELVKRLNIALSVLPPIRPPLDKLGQVDPILGKELDLPPETIVLSPVGDNQASFLGACGFDQDTPLLNLGTGGQISIPSSDFVFHKDLETRPMPLGGFLLVGASLCGGRSYALLKDFFKNTIQAFTGQELSDDNLYAAMENLVPQKGHDLNVDTRFAGTRDNPDKRGKIENIGVDNFTPSSLTGGLLRGMVEELTNMPPPRSFKSFRKILASGNAVRNISSLRLLIRETTSLPCELADTREEAALGAALAAERALNESQDK